MKHSSTFKIYSDHSQLPQNWDEFIGNNIFLSRNYLKVLDDSAPTNMRCHYIGIFVNHELSGVAISQFLDLNQLQSFGNRDKKYKAAIRNFIFKNFNSHILFIGNNMLTGQNAFYLSKKISDSEAAKIIIQATEDLKLRLKEAGKIVHITTYKDFSAPQVQKLEPYFKDYYKFSIHPNMVFDVAENWKSFDDYIGALNKKYRDQYKRAVKRAQGIVRRKMDLDDIIKHEEIIYALYFHVANNAPFNTFLLAKNHFRSMKVELGENFKFYGYFEGEIMIGFNTLIKNNHALETYFLGYDSDLQREKMLYLNMLYDMVSYAIKKNFKKIIFARTALEIKSSIGAVPVNMYGFLKHRNPLLQRKMASLFNYFEPKVIWKQRNPFK